jgi:hypothetical protein
MPEDGTERHPAPVHLVLTNDTHYQQSIQMSRQSEKNGDARVPPPGSDLPSAVTDSQDRLSQDSTVIAKAPRLAFAIRLKNNFSAAELSTDLFVEWLRTMPTIAAEVKVEAGFDSFSTLAIVSIPISFSGYLPSDPAVISLGPITSSNRVKISSFAEEHAEELEATLATTSDSFSSLPPLSATEKNNQGSKSIANDEM